MSGGRTLVTGWFSFPRGEATAGDVLALRHVEARLDLAGASYDVAWSPGFRSQAVSLEDADPQHYSRLLFVCGPVAGKQIAALHERFAHCFRVALGVSTVDPADPALSGFHRVMSRDGPGTLRGRVDLAASAPAEEPVPVAGVVLAGGRRERGAGVRDDAVAEALTSWMCGKNCARLELDTRLDAHDWRRSATCGQYLSVLERLDVVVTDRLHGLVLALRSGVPALAVDPVDGGATVSAQARVCRWPAVLHPEDVTPRLLDHWWSWCLGRGRELAAERGRDFRARRPARYPSR
ncbi:polysaccharide pyruvyl transferase family protein [Streptomyces sp. DSM 42041]|uniref:Polysaccharide pyruvyl transferase family protein n=1 Tax=Streptomyces hazeniae TaxID=3075538 RepID=A0ABU2NX21_9ACTN|nr:polysaccharide pyruvyl transferase family protein [Streptomyces sp. DSM 42041]MDT0381538.1 polysaccharide pyruvyl transferase family protein [Streptomyces sp. DSM 42041]